MAASPPSHHLRLRKAEQSPNGINPKPMPRHTRIHHLKTKDRAKISKSAKEKRSIT